MIFAAPRSALLVLLLACGIAVGCGDDETGTVAGGGGAAAGGGGAGGTGGTLEALGCADDIVWTAGAAITPRDHHATFGFEVDGTGYLFAAGGTNYTQFFGDVQSAAIGSDPLSVEWTPAADLPFGRSGHAVATLDKHAFLVGGRINTSFLTDTISASLNDDGSLGAWTEHADLPAGRFHLAMVASSDQLIVTGGLDWDSQAATDNVFTTKPTAGVVESWQSSQLPVPRSHHTSFVAGNYVYIAGGLEGSPSGIPTWKKDVWRAPLLDAGGVGSWEQVGDLPETRVTHSSFVRGRCVYLAGGIVDLAHSDAVIAASFDENGDLGEWQTLPSKLPIARSHTHHVALLGEHAYLVGGGTAPQEVTGDSAIGAFIHSDAGN